MAQVRGAGPQPGNPEPGGARGGLEASQGRPGDVGLFDAPQDVVFFERDTEALAQAGDDGGKPGGADGGGDGRDGRGHEDLRLDFLPGVFRLSAARAFA